VSSLKDTGKGKEPITTAERAQKKAERAQKKQEQFKLRLFRQVSHSFDPSLVIEGIREGLIDHEHALALLEAACKILCRTKTAMRQVEDVKDALGRIGIFGLN
jgi:hypothetical protein